MELRRALPRGGRDQGSPGLLPEQGGRHRGAQRLSAATEPTEGSPGQGVGTGLSALRPETARADALRILRQAFEAAGLDTPALDARVLLDEVAGVNPTSLLMQPRHPLGEEAAQKLAGAARRRLRREPVARILGHRDFWGLSFALGAHTLVPRPDSETVVATALRLVAQREAPLRVLDLGTGSGCLLVALLAELPRAVGLGIDCSPEALAVARRNAGRNGVGERVLFALGHWGGSAVGAFDLVVANPPYIARDALDRLDPEVRDHDPRAALDGGPDGLACYRAILAEAPRLLGREGRAVIEIGFDQERPVRGMAERAGLEVLEAARDLGGHVRALAVAKADRVRCS